MSYYSAFICKRGHIASSSGKYTTKFCERCGSEIISNCPKCNARILGSYYDEDVLFIPKYSLPYYCGSCGEPYPWTQDVIDRAIELLSLDEDLDDETKSLLRDKFPDLIVETPGSTGLAVAVYKKYLAKASKFLQDGMRQLILDVACESVKKVFFG